MIKPPADLLFVYGTLRQGYAHPMARVLAKQARHLGMARMAGRLYRVSSYPGAVRDDSGRWVTGDLFQLLRPAKLLRQLDRYEGCARGQSMNPAFIRQRVEVKLPTSKALTAWVYLYNRSVVAYPEIAGGDFLALPGLARGNYAANPHRDT